MYYGEDVLFNDEQRIRIKEASRKAAQEWRFRHVKRPVLRVLSAVAQHMLDVAKRGIDAIRYKSEQAHGSRPLTLTEQR